MGPIRRLPRWLTPDKSPLLIPCCRGKASFVCAILGCHDTIFLSQTPYSTSPAGSSDSRPAVRWEAPLLGPIYLKPVTLLQSDSPQIASHTIGSYSMTPNSVASCATHRLPHLRQRLPLNNDKRRVRYSSEVTVRRSKGHPMTPYFSASSTTS
jgi:hypothetical protein